MTEVGRGLTVDVVLCCFQINSYLLGLLIKMRALQSQRSCRVRNLVVIALQFGEDGLLFEGADAVG